MSLYFIFIVEVFSLEVYYFKIAVNKDMRSMLQERLYIFFFNEKTLNLMFDFLVCEIFVMRWLVSYIYFFGDRRENKNSEFPSPFRRIIFLSSLYIGKIS